MNQEQQSILQYLQTNANGQGNKKTSGTISNALNIPGGGLTNEHVRDLITDMIVQGCLIGSESGPNGGYWIINNRQECLDVIGDLHHRAQEVIDRASRLKQFWNQANPNNQIP